MKITQNDLFAQVKSFVLQQANRSTKVQEEIATTSHSSIMTLRVSGLHEDLVLTDYSPPSSKECFGEECREGVACECGGGACIWLNFNADEGWGVFADLNWWDEEGACSEHCVCGQVAAIWGSAEQITVWAEAHAKSIADRHIAKAINALGEMDDAHWPRLMKELRQQAEARGYTDPATTLARDVAALSVWDYDKDDGTPYTECDEPEEGYLDSHRCLMDLIERARTI
ncbi:MAG: hypothetical protein IT475_11675 [Aquimonas sp.]|nr:hypothetical protein [Aquimonas sp.]